MMVLQLTHWSPRCTSAKWLLQLAVQRPRGLVTGTPRKHTKDKLVSGRP